MKKLRYLSLLAFSALSLSSCSFSIASSSISSSNPITPFSIAQPGQRTSSSSSTSSSTTSSESSSSSKESSATSKRAGYSKWTYKDVDSKSAYHTTPSIGSPKIIVVPVEFSDISDQWNSKKLKALNIALNGSNGEGGTTPYWESVSSYYAKSSYGLFTPSFVVSDVLTPTINSRSFVQKEEQSDGGGVNDIINNDYSSITIGGKEIDVDDYDIDLDGYIDGIFFLYNEFDYDYIEETLYYWAYVYYYNDLDTIPINTYGNMGGAFFYQGNDDGYDTHTFIHEFGHSFGLDDYYSYDNDVKYSASGGLMMMDLNIGDHDAFSKYSVGWINPYLAEKGSKVTLDSFESSGDALILPSGYWNGSAFSEYYIIDFYHKEGLGELDATTKYLARPLYFKENGVRVYHIDARLGKITYSVDPRGNGSETFYGYLSSSATSIPEVSSTATTETWYGVAANNSINTRSYSKKSLISFVTSNNSLVYNRSYVSDELTWKQGSTISLSTASRTLTNGKWNSGDSFDWEVHIDSISDSQAVLTIN